MYRGSKVIQVNFIFIYFRCRRSGILLRDQRLDALRLEMSYFVFGNFNLRERRDSLDSLFECCIATSFFLAMFHRFTNCSLFLIFWCFCTYCPLPIFGSDLKRSARKRGRDGWIKTIHIMYLNSKCSKEHQLNFTIFPPSKLSMDIWVRLHFFFCKYQSLHSPPGFSFIKMIVFVEFTFYDNTLKIKEMVDFLNGFFNALIVQLRQST